MVRSKLQFVSFKSVAPVASGRRFWSSPRPLAGRWALAEVDPNLSEVFGQTWAETSHCGGRHLGFPESVKDGRWVREPRVWPDRCEPRVCSRRLRSDYFTSAVTQWVGSLCLRQLELLYRLKLFIKYFLKKKKKDHDILNTKLFMFGHALQYTSKSYGRQQYLVWKKVICPSLI